MEGGLARLIGSGFNKGCVLPYYSITEFESTYSCCLLERGRSHRDVLSFMSFLFEGVLFVGGIEYVNGIFCLTPRRRLWTISVYLCDLYPLDGAHLNFQHLWLISTL